MKVFNFFNKLIYFIFNRDFIFNNLNLFLFKIKRKSNIYFLVNEEQKWSTDQLYLELKKHFDVKIVLLGNPYTGKIENNVYDFFSKKGDVIIYPKLNFFQKLKLLFKGDIIFFQQPWGMENKIRYMHFFCLTIYIPYSAITVKDSIDYNVENFHRYLWLYVAQNEHVFNFFKEFQLKRGINCKVLGYPKFDDLYREYLNDENIFHDFGKKKIIYAPHHSLENSILGLGTFDKYFEILVNIVGLKRSSFVYKPHPRLEYTLTCEELFFSIEDYEEYLKKWNNRINSKIMNQGDYGSLFSESDFIITDCSSFLIEYFFTGKPIIWLKSDRQKIDFNSFVEELKESFYIVNSCDDILKYIEMLENDEDIMKETREILISKYKKQILGSSNNIVDYLLNLKGKKC